MRNILTKNKDVVILNSYRFLNRRDFISKFTLGSGNITWQNATSSVYANTSLTNFSVEFYFILYQNTGNYAGGIANGLIYGTPSNYSWFIGFNNSSINFQGRDINSLSIINHTYSILLNTEYKVKIVVNSGVFEIWVNGVKVIDSTYTGTIDYTRSTLDSWRDFTLGGRRFNTLSADAAIDDVKITNLDNNQIAFYSSSVYSGIDNISDEMSSNINDVTKEKRI